MLEIRAPIFYSVAKWTWIYAGLLTPATTRYILVLNRRFCHPRYLFPCIYGNMRVYVLTFHGYGK